MGLRELKKELSHMDKSDIIKLISDMYCKIPAAKEFLDIFSGEKIDVLAEKYKKEIEKYIYPNGPDMVLREKEARKLILTVRKMKIIELNVDLELFYIECCLDVIQDFGYFDEKYYIAIENMFDCALKGIHEMGGERKYKGRINNISDIASNYGMELHL